MEAVVVSYRRGARTQNTRQSILQPSGSKNKADAEKLLGKTVEWTTSAGAKMTGKVTRVHGGNGAVVAQFAKGLPGQSMGTKAKIL